MGINNICFQTQNNDYICSGRMLYNPFDIDTEINQISVGNRATCFRSNKNIRCQGYFFNEK